MPERHGDWMTQAGADPDHAWPALGERHVERAAFALQHAAETTRRRLRLWLATAVWGHALTGLRLLVVIERSGLRLRRRAPGCRLERSPLLPDVLVGPRAELEREPGAANGSVRRAGDESSVLCARERPAGAGAGPA